jgi:hypothetical protein
MAYQVAKGDEHRKPGAQNPSRYPQIGPNYQYYGEQAGWVYNPWTDSYQPDPNAQQKYAEDMGLTEPTPGLFESVLPIAAASTALGVGTSIGGEIPGLFGIGGGSTPTPPTPAGAGAATPPTPSISSASNVPSGSTPAPSSASNAPSAPAPIVNSSGAEAIGMNADGTYQFADGTSGMPAGNGGLLNTGYGNQGGIGGYVGAAVGGYNAFNAAKDGDYTDAMIHGTRGLAAYGTGGLSELAAQGIDAVAGKGTTNKVIDPLLRYNPVTGPFMFAADALSHKSTKDYQAERRAALGKEAPAWQQHLANVQANNDASNANPDFVDPNWAKGEKWSFDKANELNKKDGVGFVTTMGNAETIGDDFFKAPTEKQTEFSKRASQEGLYHSDKGDVLIKDSKQERARQLWEEVNSPDYKPSEQSSAAPTVMQGSGTPQQSGGQQTVTINGTTQNVNPRMAWQSSGGDMDISKAKPKILIRNPDGSVSYPGEGGAYDKWFEDLQKNKGKPLGNLGGLLGVDASSGGSPRSPSVQAPQPVAPEKKKGLFGLYY